MLNITTSDIEKSKDWLTRIHNSDRNIFIDKTNNAIKNNLTYIVEYRIKHKDGHYLWVEGAGGVVQTDKNNNPIKLAGTLREITQRKLLELDNLKNKDYLNLLFNENPNIVVVADTDSLLDVNKVFLDFFGFESIEDFKLNEKRFSDYFEYIDDDRYLHPSKNRWIEKALSDDNCRVMIKKDDKDYYFSTIVKPILVENEQYYLITLVDITYIVQAQSEQIRKDKLIYEQSKMVSLAEMIENIAHQWRQPLSTISTSASGILVEHEMGILKDENLENRLHSIVNTTEQLSKTIEEFNKLNDKNRKLKWFRINDCLNHAYSLIESNFINKNIKLKTKIDKNIEIYNYENDLVQTFVNILNNSYDAIVKNDIEERVIFIDIKVINNNLNIKIKDLAGGVEKDNLPRIFEPFFTTKHQYKFTGMSLFMSRDFIENISGGRIVARNQTILYKNKKYTGALFTITIPVKLENK
jgi:signal transduction histidine kinase